MFANRIFITLYVFLHIFSLIYSSNVYRSASNNSKTVTNQSQTSIKDNANWMQRAITTSQVLTFNITNALILLAMKGILIGAGILGKISFWKYPNLGGVPTFRAYEEKQTNEEIINQIYYSIFSNEDKRWTSAYVWAVNKHDFGCLNRLACENRHSAQAYLYSGRFFNKAIQSIFGALKITYNRHYYENILHGIQEAMNSSSDKCKTRYRCRSPFDSPVVQLGKLFG